MANFDLDLDLGLDFETDQVDELLPPSSPVYPSGIPLLGSEMDVEDTVPTESPLDLDGEDLALWGSQHQLLPPSQQSATSTSDLLVNLEDSSSSDGDANSESDHKATSKSDDEDDYADLHAKFPMEALKLGRNDFTKWKKQHKVVVTKAEKPRLRKLRRRLLAPGYSKKTRDRRRAATLKTSAEIGNLRAENSRLKHREAELLRLLAERDATIAAFGKKHPQV